jgi:membrane-associated protease RseP (regulator of RpoE activity)
MWRTKRGRKFLDKLSKRRTFWRLYGNFAILICTIGMFIMFLPMILGAYAAVTIPTEPLPPQNILVLPGINPIIPLWYGIFALAIGIIIHEFSHGILARWAKIKVKSLGLLLCIIPIGAFVEPDEKEIENVDKWSRSRIFAVGPTSNIIFGLICAAIFSWVFMASLAPVQDGVIIKDVTEDFPAEAAGIKPGMILTGLEFVDDNGTMIEEVKIKSFSDFSDFMDNRKANDTLNLTVYYNKKTIIFDNITLADTYNRTEKEEDRGDGFLGVGGAGADEFVESLAYPVQSAGDNVGKRRMNVFEYFFLPMRTSIMPFHSPVTDAYEVNGPLSVLPTSIFWGLANVFFYLFWINILLGLFNALPAVPLDGGYVFKDEMTAILERTRPGLTKEERTGVINRLSFSLAFLTLIMFLMIILGSYFLKLMSWIF